VPDWPNTYGYNMFTFPISKWVGGVLYEHSHRLVATCVGVLTTVLTLWLWVRETSGKQRWFGVGSIFFVFGLMGARVLPVYVALACAAPAAIGFAFYKLGRSSSSLRWLGIMAFAAVILQGVLGGLRVVWFKDPIGIIHATLAQLFFCLLCVVALVTSKWWEDSKSDRLPKQSCFKPGWLLPATTLLLLLQLILGATMRHQHAGLAIPDFPLAYGRFWPAMDASSVTGYNQQRFETVGFNSITSFQVGLQMAHRIMALLICVAVTFCAVSAYRQLGRNHRLTWLSAGWLGLILTQALLGASTIWSNKAADIATAHVLIGALTLALGVIINMVSSRGVVLSLETAPECISTRFPTQASVSATFR